MAKAKAHDAETPVTALSAVDDALRGISAGGEAAQLAMDELADGGIHAMSVFSNGRGRAPAARDVFDGYGTMAGAAVYDTSADAEQTENSRAMEENSQLSQKSGAEMAAEVTTTHCRHLESRPKAAARLFLEGFAAWASPSSRGPWGGAALLYKRISTRILKTKGHEVHNT